MTSIQQIDTLLSELYGNPELVTGAETHEILGILLTKYQVFNRFNFATDLIGMLDELVHKELVKKATKTYFTSGGISREEPLYTISFTGIIFYQQGGYQGELNRLNSDKTRLQKAENRIFVLTLILAISGVIASVYYLSEMSRPASIISSLSFVTLLFVLLAGVLKDCA